MKNFLIKTFSIIAVLASANIAMAKDSSCGSCKICEPCEPCKPCCTEVPKTGEPCNCAYNAPARIDPACGWDAWVKGSFIYWQPKQEDLELGVHDTSNDDGTLRSFEIVDLKTDYHPGFKIGVGASTDRDDWTLYLEYTRFKSKDSKTVDLLDSYSNNPPVNKMTSSWLNPLGSGTSIFYMKSTWDFNLNMLALDLGRPFYLGKNLVIKPSCGIKGGWIDQKYNLTFSDDVLLAYASNKQDSWLIGPSASIDSSWFLGCNFRVLSQISGSLSYQKFTATATQTTPIEPSSDSDQIMEIKRSFSQLTPEINLSLGLGYGTYFCNNEWFIDLTVGYDFNYIWNQAHMQREIEIVKRESGNIGSLMLHGLTMTARLDF